MSDGDSGEMSEKSFLLLRNDEEFAAFSFVCEPSCDDGAVGGVPKDGCEDAPNEYRRKRGGRR